MIQIFENTQQLTEAAAALFIDTAKEAIAKNNKFTVALTGGSSPIALHNLLASADYQQMIDWKKVYVFWGDERWVPFEDDRSNTKMAFETLLNHVPIPEENIYNMYSETASPEAYATQYEADIKKVVGEDGVFDLILLGMGDDGHTASLFPHTAILAEDKKWVDAYYLEPQSMYRITLTAPLINKAKNIAVLTFGDKKTDALYEVLEGERNPQEYPSQLLAPSHGKLVFMTDQAAAKRLKKSY
ncbi:6-phosphogluconolactonase [Sphingobacterium faecale]|uniref:6-phosphogluconolactonase n=1 Tax=Sphingobacterium faecale TaxID=2803775 RepID=A0ABS1R3R1_9SPHI|nr:6-phosphogluconolactonase [Sphingobacterium faecale]MBL1408506.1 6-phosphogluconolactonase [Sphingobacterium faecale]